MSDNEDDKSATDDTAQPAANAAPPRVKLQLDDAVARGVYANMALLSHSETEFVVDFAFVPPTRVGARVRSRVVMGPRQAKRLAASLAEQIARYERRFGPIPQPQPADEPQLH